MKQTNPSLVKSLIWVGVIGAIILIAFGINALVAPPQIGDTVVNPVLFQVKNVLEIIGFMGYAMICLAFYLSGVVKQDWLAKFAIILAFAGGITASVVNVFNAIAIHDVTTPDWVNLLMFGLLLLAPVLLGINTIRMRKIVLWQSLYPIFVVGILSIAIWIVFGDAGPSFPSIFQALAWIGFALITNSNIVSK